MGLPEFATPQQRAQFNVDENYTPHTKLEDIVGHAQTVDIAAGTFAKKQRHSTEVDLCWDQVKIPYGALLVLERIEGRKGWTPNLYAIPPVNYRNVTTQFDTGYVLREGEKQQEKREQAAAAK
ncbi:hypothetical protein TELCIR_01841 [Teladorsagia circumcincta]|uniref:Uncharacterized protein n=1 Tax=Teladorsagia circumcincta TaxID=45464 RepID=A0A2G9V0V1_TELCI|nr:hypothetical protein TELCIR_01841 [Teladorsagia circumcincta]